MKVFIAFILLFLAMVSIGSLFALPLLFLWVANTMLGFDIDITFKAYCGVFIMCYVGQIFGALMKGLIHAITPGNLKGSEM